MNKIEIERKFLVKPEAIETYVEKFEIIQGYIFKSEKGSGRIRIEQHGIDTYDDVAYLTTKKVLDYMSNDETNSIIPVEDAEKILKNFSDNLIYKLRHIRYANENKWEIDVFHKPNNGLILAEVELVSPDQELIWPEWVLEEVTGQPQYYNANM